MNYFSKITFSVALILASPVVLIGCTDKEIDQFFSDFDRMTGAGKGTAIAAPSHEMAPVKGRCTLHNTLGDISREQLSRLIHIAPGNSGAAMHELLGAPYCFTFDTEYYVLDPQDGLWVGVQYDAQGLYQGYIFSANNY